MRTHMHADDPPPGPALRRARSSTASAWRCRSAPGSGLDPWDVFHQGVADHTGLSFGTVVIIIGALVLLAWIPLRQKPGLGTVSNVFVIGLVVDVTLVAAPRAPGRCAVAARAAARRRRAQRASPARAYIGAGLGPGPARRPDDRARAPHRRLGAA